MRVLATVTAEIKQAIAKALTGLTSEQAAGLVSDPSRILLETPKEKAHGDYATNVAMLLAKVERQNPRALAQAIVEQLETEGTWIEAAEVAGPGFINFRLRHGWLHQVLPAIEAAGDQYGKSDHGGGKKILLEYISANPTGPMLLVQARSGAFGSALANLLNAAGYDCHTEFLVNDAGNQVQVLAQTVDIRLRQLKGEEIELPEGAYPGEYVIDLARQLLAEQPDFLEQPEDQRLAFLEIWAPEQFRQQQEEVLADYGVRFERWFSERSLHEAGEVAKVVDFLKAKGQAYEADGAVWLRTTDYGDDKDRVLVRADGRPTYFNADIAYHLNKYSRGYEHLINILGQDHHGYQGRMKAAVQALGYPEESLELIFTQMVRLIKDGEIVRMSKRQGEMVLMEDLLDEVSADAARFFFLLRSIDSHMDFDMDLAKLSTSDNPVYYVQYAHARICSLMEQAREAGVTPAPASGLDLSVLADPAELDLLRHLAEFPEEVIAAAEAREPQRISRYVTELATLFHSFYNRCRVLGEEQVVTLARLALAEATRVTLKNGLSLLGVSAPERM